ncbi:MAG: penicillin-binding protein 2 [Acidobacteriota bacterium]
MRIDYKQLRPYREYQEARQLSLRLLVLQTLVAAGFVLFAGIFWYLQVVEGAEYRALAEENRLRRLPARPVRGALRDADGEVLATNRPSFAVYLDRERTDDPRREVERLARFLGEPPDEMLARVDAARSSPRFVPVLVLPDVGLEVAARIAAHRPELPAIDVETDPKRYYPLGPAAAHVLGYVSESTGRQVREEGLLPGQRVGQTGIELAFDRELRGEPGIVLEEVNARGRPLRRLDTMKPVVHGDGLTLTLDADLQREIHAAYEGRAGAAVFLNPHTGAVLALYSGPSFDPNLFSGRLSPEQWTALVEDPRRPLQNRAVASAYSPGSTFKVVMAAAGLGEHVIEPGERVFCAGSRVFYGQRRFCHFRGGHGWVDVETAITRSCNVFFYEVGDRLGIERIADWARRFGLGTKNGIGLPAEASGLVPSDEWKRRTRGEPWYPGETISVAIGQGPLLVTPLQMAVVAAAIANGGQRVHPHLLPGAGAPGEPVGLDQAALEHIRRGMRDVVESDRGTARRARVRGIEVAGKTGTAQVVRLGEKNDPGDHAWFIGFAPVADPGIAFAVLVEHGGHGGSAAAPIAARVVTRWLEERDRERAPETLVAQARGGEAP